jgi:hypothetical protein
MKAWPVDYMTDDVKSPYGTSPLMKGQPIQDAATMALNSLMGATALNAEPPIAYDGNDHYLAGSNGPELYPRAQFKADSPNAIEPIIVGDIGGLLNTYLGLLKQYEDTVGVNDPRRGAAVRSHTTTGAHDLEASRGIARTDDFVTAVEQGPLAAILDREWRIIKEFMKTPRSINVNNGGMEGWAKLAAADLPDTVMMEVHGSAGVLNERDRASNFFAAVQFGLQIVAQAQQLGQPVNVNWQELIQHGFIVSGEQNASRFFGNPAEAQPVPSGAEGGTGVQGATNGAAPPQIAGLGSA